MNRFLLLTKNVLMAVKYHRLLKFDFDPLNFTNLSPTTITAAIISAVPQSSSSLPQSSSSTINELMQDGMLWGVPKKRRTVEQRLMRRFGVPNYPDCAKILRPRNDLVICERCGTHHEYFAICPGCYKKVKEDTKKILEARKAQTDPLMPKEKEIWIQFKDEEAPNEEVKKQFQVIDMSDQPRPRWFSRELMTKSTPSAQSFMPKDVIMDPKDLIKENNKKN